MYGYVCVCVCPLLQTALSLTDLAEAITLRFASDMYMLSIWPALQGSESCRNPLVAGNPMNTAT